MIIGLYEAYITKVLWSPTWAPEWTLSFGGVYLVHFIILVLVWHPFMAFIVPLCIAEISSTKSRDSWNALSFLRISSHKTYGAIGFVTFALYCGIYKSVSSPPIDKSMNSSILALIYIILSRYLFKKVSQSQAYDHRELLPTKGELKILLIMLGLLYFFSTTLLRVEALPKTITPHLTIVGIYCFLFYLIRKVLKKQSCDYTEKVISEVIIAPKMWVALIGAFLLASSLYSHFPKIGPLVVVLSWIIGSVIGLKIILKSIKTAFM